MAHWYEFERASPGLADRGDLLFRESHGYSYLATLRLDGSPRLHAVVPVIAGGYLCVAVMERSPKTNDLRRDPRCALHAHVGLEDEEFVLLARAVEVVGDAKRRWLELAAETAVVRPGQPVFELELLQVDHAVWRDGKPLRTRWSAT